MSIHKSGWLKLCLDVDVSDDIVFSSIEVSELAEEGRESI
jgi:hypothetical protein